MIPIIVSSTLFLFSLLASKRQQLSSSVLSASILPPMISRPVEQSNYDDLLSWLRSKENCIIHDSIFVSPSSRGGGFGAFCSDTVEAGEMLLSIPRSACVTMDQVDMNDEISKKFMDKVGPGGSTVLLAGFLAKEYLTQSSTFGPYLQTLPWERGINSQEHVLFWETEDVERSLKGSFCYRESTELRAEVDLAIKVLNSIIGPSIRVSRGEELESGFRFPWQPAPPSNGVLVDGLANAVKGAFVSLLTRGFEDGSSGDKLVPVLDMLQHSDDPNICHVMRIVDGTVEVRAKRRIEEGEELLNQYRSEDEESMPFHRFFTRFGFVPGIMEPVENLLQDKSSIFYAKVVEV